MRLSLSKWNWESSSLRDKYIVLSVCLFVREKQWVNYSKKYFFNKRYENKEKMYNTWAYK